jgi:hypothetical protein
MARLRRDQGRLAEAHDLLAPIYGWFTEGSHTLDPERGQNSARCAGNMRLLARTSRNGKTLDRSSSDAEWRLSPR